MIVARETNKCIKAWGCRACCMLLVERKTTHTRKAPQLHNSGWSTGVQLIGHKEPGKNSLFNVRQPRYL